MIKLLNTRPQHQAFHLTDLIEKSDGAVFHLPLMEIEPVAFESANLGDFDWVIFTSANAVKYGIEGQGSGIDKHFFEKHPKIIAIGSATKQALIKYTNDVLCPANFSSEGILQMPELRRIQKKSIAIISGENPKPLLKNELTKRGAAITHLLTYRRKKINYNIEEIFPGLLRFDINVIPVTSNENFLYLLDLFSEKKYRDWLLSKTLCVINDTLQKKAIDAGFTRIIQASDATDQAILRSLLCIKIA